MTEHPITPPPTELVQQWVDTYFGGKISQSNFHVDLATRAAQWGADQELEACCEWLGKRRGWEDVTGPLRAARRPTPLSLKEQSIALLDLIQGNKDRWQLEDLDVVRRALEQLDD